MKIASIIDYLEEEFPPQVAWERDRIGLQLESEIEDISTILLTMELNEEVVKEAIEKDSKLIISFHPLIFNPILKLSKNDRVSKIIKILIKHDINLYVIHTNFDAHKFGTSYSICKKLEIKPRAFLTADKELAEYGMGVIIELNSVVSLDKMLSNLSKVFNSPLRYNEGKSKEIKKMAILGGSGSKYIDRALEENVDLFITADVNYHDFHKVNNLMTVVDPGHYEMEQFVSDAMYEIIRPILDKNVKIIKSEILTNPVNYYPKENFLENQSTYIKKGL